MSKIGFIGMGNMAQAIASGFISGSKISGDDIFAYAPNQEKLMANAESIGFNAMTSAREVVKACDYVIIACKPYQIDAVLDEIGEDLKGKALLSVAAGWVFDSFNALLDDVRIQCIMPNTPAMVSEGVILFEEKNTLTEDELNYMLGMFEALGMVEIMPTKLMGIGGAISGCGPAFMDLIMEAYGDAAVKYGIARSTAYRLISQTMLGSAKLMQETGSHPGMLKDAVCSPGGTTIKGVASLEKNGLRSACIESIDAIMNK